MLNDPRFQRALNDAIQEALAEQHAQRAISRSMMIAMLKRMGGSVTLRVTDFEQAAREYSQGLDVFVERSTEPNTLVVNLGQRDGRREVDVKVKVHVAGEPSPVACPSCGSHTCVGAHRRAAELQRAGSNDPGLN